MKLAPALALAPAPPWYPKFGPYIYIVILSIHHLHIESEIDKIIIK